MKRLRLSLLVLVLLAWAGCDFLSYDETDGFSSEDIFSEFGKARNFLNNVYSQLPGGFNSVSGAMRSSATDDAEEVNELAAVQQFNNGSWSAIATVDDEWAGMYEGIRAANIFLQEGAGRTFEDRRYTEEYEQQMEQYGYYLYQARFLRAYFYFELLRRYGGVPLVTSVLTAEEANSVASASFEEVVDFIVSEIDAIAPNLPVDYRDVSGDETGRATRGAALALKARTLLYAASPLHNPSGDQNRWVQAARAAKDVMDMGVYSLEEDYDDVMNNRTSPELIWERRLGDSNSFERSNFPVGYEGSNPGTAPTQNLVDSYEMQDTGLPIGDAGSGYDPANPYEGRDPRLYETVILNDSPWKGRDVEIWVGGRDGLPQSRATDTGYYLKKGVVENVDLSPNNTTSAIHTWPFFRYAEVLLNYAEAMNEAYGPDNASDLGMTAREAVNLVRARAGMPEFPAGIDQGAFREKLRNERRVELAFEDHRFWDIRRWMIGPTTTDIYGMTITRNGDGSFSYEPKLVEQRVWEDRMNLYPIPQSEVFKNENLQQNPGW